MNRILSIIASCFLLSACATVPTKTSELPASMRAGIAQILEVKSTEKGVMYIDLQEGNGGKAENGVRVLVEYTAMFEDGVEFDSSKGQKPFSFRVGSHKVIPGWDDGIIGMKVGGKRRLIVPPSLAYGTKGVPGTVPPDATLIFDMELLRVEK